MKSRAEHDKHISIGVERRPRIGAFESVFSECIENAFDHKSMASPTRVGRSMNR